MTPAWALLWKARRKREKDIGVITYTLGLNEKYEFLSKEVVALINQVLESNESTSTVIKRGVDSVTD